ncbi:hypothetical protein [Belnapia moabensis]|uniref:hypothetical protein n=1 Tax=Belnapia moabensis TaxID=365533 RepID=UPI0012EE0725|nr:hypothetical protein [Belnapia moabensis]
MALQSAATKWSGRKISSSYVSEALKIASEKYAESTGKALPPDLAVFIANYLNSTVDLIWDAASRGKLKPKDIAIYSLKKALDAANLSAKMNDAKGLECGIALVSLAVATVEAFELLPLIAFASSTGAGAPIVAVIAVGGVLFWSYQVFDTVATCSAGFQPPRKDELEKAVPAKYEAASKRAMFTNYADQICSAAPKK